MNYINKNKIKFSVVFMLTLFISGCNKMPDNETKTAMGEDHAEEAHEHEKLIHLNEAQFLNAGIDTGWFELKNLSEVINANGYTKLPPQNQAEVSVQIPGTIQSIKVIEGQYVKAGQTLATIQSMAYNNMRLERIKP
jgi:cobalt-zinc-cadmium efflux system membrane fusion protein